MNRLVESLGKMQADLQVLKELKVRVDKTRAVLNGSAGWTTATAVAPPERRRLERRNRSAAAAVAAADRSQL